MVIFFHKRGSHGPYRMVVGLQLLMQSLPNHHLHFDFEYCSWRGVPDTTLYDKVSQ
jgi:hypothetical protein